MHRRVVSLISIASLCAAVRIAAPAAPGSDAPAPSAPGDIVINEIMYNSADVDTEYVELFNAGTSTIDLAGWSLRDDDDAHVFTIPGGVALAPGSFLVVSADTIGMRARYGGAVPVVGNLDFGLGNGGDAVRLFDDGSTMVDDVAYDDDPPWPPEADGDGPSLELIDPASDNGLASSWGVSLNGYPAGTPGAPNTVLVARPPVISDLTRVPGLPIDSDVVTIAARIVDDDVVVSTAVFVSDGGGYSPTAMRDDGMLGDAVAGDSVYTAVIAPRATGTAVRYFVSAVDGGGRRTNVPAGAPTTVLGYVVGYTPPRVRINEIVADNATTASDEAGDYDDWIEILNVDAVSVDLGGMYLSDDAGETQMWAVPSTPLAPGERVMFWADGDPADGPRHTTFRLSAGGESLFLFDAATYGNTVVDAMSFGPQQEDVSFGYFPEGDATAPEYLLSPTPGTPNDTSQLFSAVCLNELLTTSAIGGVDDWIEIYNRGDSAVGIGAWGLTDDADEPMKYRFPAGTTIGENEYLVVFETALGFSLSSSGSEVVMLTGADSTTVQDYYDYGPQEPDVSEGRVPNGVASWTALTTPTPGGPNPEPLGISPGSNGPAVLVLHAAPNPGLRSVRLSLSLLDPADLAIDVFDVSGRRVRRLFAGRLESGEHALDWDGRDDDGRTAAAGRYLIRVDGGGRTSTLPIVRMD